MFLQGCVYMFTQIYKYIYAYINKITFLIFAGRVTFLVKVDIWFL